MPKIITLYGKEFNWNLGRIKQSSNPSKLHLRCREFIKGMWPYTSFYEELKLPGTKTSNHGVLFADFYIPSMKLIIECQGSQHNKFNSHFFNDKLEFYRAKQRDISKKKWARINYIDLVELFENETDDEWKMKILKPSNNE